MLCHEDHRGKLGAIQSVMMVTGVGRLSNIVILINPKIDALRCVFLCLNINQSRTNGPVNAHLIISQV